MNAYITFIQTNNANDIYCLNTTLLSSYILTDDEQQYIDSLTDDTTSTISTLKLNASTKAGSSLYTQPELNKIYARRDDSSYSETDKYDLKNFLNEKLVGNKIVKFSEF
jgi:hypothetical protein